MGKRKKSSKPPPKKKRPVLSKVFDCPFCDHAGSCSCELKRDAGIGKIECNVCNATFSTPINNLSEAIDVYSDWIDACERANTQAEEDVGEVGEVGEEYAT
uniref:Transcription elongation factor 1 homolog n=1 Tax=Physarum polycephalum TaxID=5791 RepID=B7U159_PHYPO|nr:ELF-1-like protein [Physarum polycephalum]|eukprot:Phypoly_transcript_23434.p1 GENE.Phypoly_transcript_23434~~Phypoly_transcript_23434.p1  ORF type:complete len:101 (+),score=13.20 Phypoly_transcript_23434:41-343(+)